MEGLNQIHGANLALNSDVDQDTFGKVKKHNKHEWVESRAGVIKIVNVISCHLITFSK